MFGENLLRKFFKNVPYPQMAESAGLMPMPLNLSDMLQADYIMSFNVNVNAVDTDYLLGTCAGAKYLLLYATIHTLVTYGAQLIANSNTYVSLIAVYTSSGGAQSQAYHQFKLDMSGRLYYKMTSNYGNINCNGTIAFFK